MRTTASYFKIIIGLSLLLLFTSCDSVDNEKEWGNALLYMPQSTLQSAGVNCNYTIKVENIATDQIVIVGLYRSGLQELQAAKVDLSVDSDSLFKAIDIANSGISSDYEMYKRAKLLPEDYYTLPNEISIQNAEREGHVELVLNRAKLAVDPFFITGNRYILPLRISNPTRYELNLKLSLTMFVFEPK